MTAAARATVRRMDTASGGTSAPGVAAIGSAAQRTAQGPARIQRFGRPSLPISVLAGSSLPGCGRRLPAQIPHRRHPVRGPYATHPRPATGPASDRRRACQPLPAYHRRQLVHRGDPSTAGNSYAAGHSPRRRDARRRRCRPAGWPALRRSVLGALRCPRSDYSRGARPVPPTRSVLRRPSRNCRRRYSCVDIRSSGHLGTVPLLDNCRPSPSGDRSGQVSRACMRRTRPPGESATRPSPQRVGLIRAALPPAMLPPASMVGASLAPARQPGAEVSHSFASFARVVAQQGSRHRTCAQCRSPGHPTRPDSDDCYPTRPCSRRSTDQRSTDERREIDTIAAGAGTAGLVNGRAGHVTPTRSSVGVPVTANSTYALPTSGLTTSGPVRRTIEHRLTDRRPANPRSTDRRSTDRRSTDRRSTDHLGAADLFDNRVPAASAFARNPSGAVTAYSLLSSGVTTSGLVRRGGAPRIGRSVSAPDLAAVRNNVGGRPVPGAPRVRRSMLTPMARLTEQRASTATRLAPNQPSEVRRSFAGTQPPTSNSQPAGPAARPPAGAPTRPGSAPFASLSDVSPGPAKFNSQFTGSPLQLRHVIAPASTFQPATASLIRRSPAAPPVGTPRGRSTPPVPATGAGGALPGTLTPANLAAFGAAATGTTQLARRFAAAAGGTAVARSPTSGPQQSRHDDQALLRRAVAVGIVRARSQLVRRRAGRHHRSERPDQWRCPTR